MPLRRLVTIVVLAGAVAFHLAGVTAVLRQPLSVNRATPDQRPWYWSLFSDAVHRPGPAVDFFAIYHAGVNVHQGADVYRFDEQPRVTPYSFPYRYLPVVAHTLGAALANLPPRVAWQVWILILEILLAILILLVWRSAVPADVRTFAVVVLLANMPYLLELHMGQFTFAVFALLGFTLLLGGGPGAPEPGRLRRLVMALTLSAASLLKMVPLVTLPMLIRKRTYRWAAGLALVLALGLAVPWFLTHPEDWQTFRNLNFKPPGGMNAGNFGLVYVMHVLVGSSAEVAATWLHLLLLGVTALAVLSARRLEPAAAATALVLAHFLTYAHVWEHHMTGIMVMGVLFLLELAADPRDRTGKVLMIVTMTALVLLALPSAFVLLDGVKNPAVWDPSAGWSTGSRLLMPLPKVLAQLALFVACALRIADGGFDWPWRHLRAE